MKYAASLLILLTSLACSAPRHDEILDAALAEAIADWEADPASEEAAIWVGRRLGYLGRHRAALTWFSERLLDHPESFRLLRHRGHRFISVRNFEQAVEDLERAAQLIEGVPDEVERDGAPNTYALPRSTNHSNIYYHLGLAHYLRGHFDEALDAWERGLAFCTNDDMLVATTYWVWASARRQGDDARAERALATVHSDMEILENDSYWKLMRLYQGELTEDEIRDAGEDRILSSTLLYGIGHGRFLSGDVSGARAVWTEVAEEGAPAAFGTIAAQVELARLRARSGAR